MKFNFSLESDNLEEDIDKIVKTIVKAYTDSTEVNNTKKREDLLQFEVSAAVNQVRGLDNRVDGIESRLSFCETDIKSIKKEASKK